MRFATPPVAPLAVCPSRPRGALDGSRNVEAIVEHLGARSVQAAGNSGEIVPYDMPCSFIRNHQRAGEEPRFCLNSTVILSLSVALKCGAGRVPQKSMGQLVEDIASLSGGGMRIVVNYCPSHST